MACKCTLSPDCFDYNPIVYAQGDENAKQITMKDSPECAGGIDYTLSYYIPISDLKPENPFEFNEQGEITKFNLKRKGKYGGKRFDRKFHKMPEHEKESEENI